MTFDVPEGDFDFVSPQTPVSIHVLATGRAVTDAIARRSPSADPDTRTVHVEVDLADAERRIPVNTTGEVEIAVGAPVPATAIPLSAASISGTQATLFVVEGGVARRKAFQVLGEQGAALFLDQALPAGTLVVTQGRSTLGDGDPVDASEVRFSP
jgi:hypothetical protein